MAQQIEGAKGRGETDTGIGSNAVKIGGVYNVVPPALSAGTRGDVQLDAVGNVRVVVTGAGGSAGAVNSPTSSGNATAVGPTTNDQNLLFNETTWDPARNNTTQILMAASSLSASTAISITNFNGRGIFAIMNISSAFPGSASTTYALKIRVSNPLSAGSTIVLGSATPRSASGVSTLCIYPGIAASAGPNAQVSMGCPRDLQIVASLSTGATSKEVVMSLAVMTLL